MERYIISFLKEHGKEVFMDVRAAYIDTMNKVLSAHFCAYIQALEKLQLDIATAYVSTNSNNTSSQSGQKKKCYLIDCSKTGLKVAEGRVWSSNPTDTVHYNHWDDPMLARYRLTYH